MKEVEIEYIKRLLTLFYKGETSLSEEQEIMAFFEQHNVPESLKVEQSLFLKFYKEECSFSEDNLEDNLSFLITQLEEKEKLETYTIERRFLVNQPFKWISAIVAFVAILFSISLFINKISHDRKEIVLYDTFSDPKDAYRETQKVMLLVSSKLNKGTAQLENLQKNIDKANKIMNKNNIQL